MENPATPPRSGSSMLSERSTTKYTLVPSPFTPKKFTEDLPPFPRPPPPPPKDPVPPGSPVLAEGTAGAAAKGDGWLVTPVTARTVSVSSLTASEEAAAESGEEAASSAGADSSSMGASAPTSSAGMPSLVKGIRGTDPLKSVMVPKMSSPTR